MLLERLRLWAGIQGNDLNWFALHFRQRTLSEFGKFSSSSAPIKAGVLQRSKLGPVLFSIYMLPLANICQKRNISYHFYADGTQLYLPIKYNLASCPLFGCFNGIKKWMAASFLHLTESKTEAKLFGPLSSTKHTVNQLGLFKSEVHNETRNRGVAFDAQFKSDKHLKIWKLLCMLLLHLNWFTVSHCIMVFLMPHYQVSL